jgi:RNA polymerase sigma factor (sigma-70 family)
LEHSTGALSRCAAILAALNVQLGWRLDADQQHAHMAMLSEYLVGTPDDAALRMLIEHYHADHELVHALRDAGDPQHDAAWTAWSAHAVRIAQHHAFGAADDPLVDADDLAQLALEELAHALPSYRYASRFSTWAYTVIARRVQRYVRDSRAAKRAGRPASLDDQSTAIQLAIDPATIEAPAEASALLEVIMDVLSREADDRLAQIFYLWVVEERRLVQIGQQVHLSTGRVSILIGQAHQILQHNPAILAWIDQPGTERAAGGAIPAHPDKKRPARFVTHEE